MTWQFTPFAVPLFVSAFLLMVTFYASWMRRSTPGAYAYMGLTLGIMAYTLGYALEIGSLTAEQVLTSLKIEYLSVLSPPFLMIVVLQYVSDQRIRKSILYSALFAPSLMTLIFAFTNEFHGWIWTITALDRSAGFTATLFESGVWYWVNIIYTRGLIVIAVILLAIAARRERGMYRRQVRWMLVGAITPLVITIPYLLGVFPDGLDVIPYAFTLSALAIAWALFQDRLFDVMPVAREAILSSMSESVFVVDSTNRVVYLNHAAERMMGFAPEAVIGKPARDVFKQWQDLIETFRVNEQKTKEMPVKFGSAERYFNISQMPLQARGDPGKGRLLVMSDVTERVKSQQALQESLEERGKLVEDLDSFSHMVAHDLKNPLATIIGLSELIAEELDTVPVAKLRSQLISIMSSAETANGIIDALLLLAHLRAGIEVPVNPLDMPMVVELAVGRVTGLLESHSGKITIPETWLPAVGYAPWVEAMWTNYVSNAIKYGGRPPEITLGCDPAPNNKVRFWVKDNGTGLTPEQISRLFIPFSRLQAQRDGGHGLGLTIVQRIAERLNGSVGVESTPGEGSRFFFLLPAYVSEPAPAAPPAPKTDTPPVPETITSPAPKTVTPPAPLPQEGAQADKTKPSL